MNIDKYLNEFLSGLGIPGPLVNILDTVIIFIALALILIVLNLFSRTVLSSLIKRITTRTSFQFDDLLMQKNVFKYIIHIISPLIIYLLVPMFFEEGREITTLIRRICVVYIIFSLLMAVNGIILVVYENYALKRKDGYRPIRGFIQVIQVLLFCLGIILIISVLINRSPATLLAGLGASAAIFSLVFKDLITGLVAGIQLSMNDMVRQGDWVTLSDGKTDGIVQEITLITVKIKNFDNSISTVPPTVLVTNTFKNWREMLQSNGRLASRSLFVDKTSVKFATEELLLKVQRKYPLLGNEQSPANSPTTNTDLFRTYMDKYLQQRTDINSSMGLKVGELESTDRGLPILLYFFTKNKDDKNFERIQAEVFDHGTSVLPDFELVVK